MSSPVYKPNPITGLREEIRAHWCEFRPQMFRALVRSGQLEKAIEHAFQLTKEAMAEATSGGQTWDQAWEALREEWALLPPSQDPDIPFDLTETKSRVPPSKRPAVAKESSMGPTSELKTWTQKLAHQIAANLNRNHPPEK